jgi:hypothetical protein
LTVSRKHRTMYEWHNDDKEETICIKHFPAKLSQTFLLKARKKFIDIHYNPNACTRGHRGNVYSLVNIWKGILEGKPLLMFGLFSSWIMLLIIIREKVPQKER